MAEQCREPEQPTTRFLRPMSFAAARDAWLEEAENADELQRRLKSDFLCYCNHDGLFADFHSMRYLFITNLERAGVSPRRAQTLARHSDIRLTMGVYTHVELSDCSAVIELLPAPPSGSQHSEIFAEEKSGA